MVNNYKNILDLPDCAQFIAASRTIIPELVAEVERLQKEVQTLSLDLLTAQGQKEGGYE